MPIDMSVHIASGEMVESEWPGMWRVLWGGGEVERLSDQSFDLIDDERVALVCVQGAERSQVALRRVACRIRRNVRSCDIVLLLGAACIIVLPETTLEGAQAVGRRISTLLADIEYELQILCGSTAYALVQRLRAECALVIEQKELEMIPARTPSVASPITPQFRGAEPLPYLAFLANYPSQRLLHLFPYELACRYHCVPVGAERGVLTLATSQELTHEVIAKLQEVTQRNIFQVRCEVGMIDDVLNYWQRTVLV